MISVKCEHCGLINDLAAETCQQCGRELASVAQSANSRAFEYPPPPFSDEGGVSPEGRLESSPAIAPFMSIGDVLTPTYNLLRDNLWLIAKLIFLVFAPLEMFKAFSVAQGNVSWQFGVGAFALDLFCKALIAPSLIYALMSVLRTGVAPSVSESYRWGLSRLPKLVAVTVLSTILVFLGTLCLIIPGIILGLAFELIYPMATLENRGPVEILKRSYELTKGHRWNIFAATFLFGLLTALVSIPVGIASAVLVSMGINFWPVNAALALAGDIVSQSTTILSLVIYLSILAKNTRNAPWPNPAAEA